MITLVLKGTSESPLAFFLPSEGKARRQPSSQEVWGGHVHTCILFKMHSRPRTYRRAHGTLLNITVAVWMETSLGENGYMYMYGQFCCPPETITTLFVNRLYSNMKKSLKKKTAIYEPRSGPASVIRSRFLDLSPQNCKK